MSNLEPSRSSCGVAPSVSSPTLVGIWQETSCPLADCGRGPTWGGGGGRFGHGARWAIALVCRLVLAGRVSHRRSQCSYNWVGGRQDWPVGLHEIGFSPTRNGRNPCQGEYSGSVAVTGLSRLGALNSASRIDRLSPKRFIYLPMD